MPGNDVNHAGLGIVGYTDRLGARPGERIRVMVSTIHDGYEARLVRLISAETQRDGSGYLEEPVADIPATRHTGRTQPIRPGSCAVVSSDPALDLTGSFTIQAWVMATAPDRPGQTVLSRGDPDRDGYALELDPDEGMVLRWSHLGAAHRVTSGARLDGARWYFVAAIHDADRRLLRLIQRPTPAWPVEPTAASVALKVGDGTVNPATPGVTAPRPLVFAAREADPVADAAGSPRFESHFNGRIERPRIFGAALGDAQLDRLYAGTAPEVIGAPITAAWDFAADIASERIRDIGPRGLHGRVHNLPTRAVTDHTWSGRHLDWRTDPGQYGAIHFHDDDLDDVGWDVDLEVTLPTDLASGFYAVKLSADGDEDLVPVFVAAPREGPTSDLLFLAPTNTYLAYANLVEPRNDEVARQFGLPYPYPHQPEDRFALANRLTSLYNVHSDGTGVCYSSARRPIVNMRPRMNGMASRDTIGYAHGLKADLHVAGWMAARRISYDVATDADLHAEGVDLLGRYRVLLTGTHPEYWTEAMLDALEAYLAGGGRVIYLGGNGFYWVTSIDPVRPHVIEVRRWAGTRAWTARVGEYHHSSTGELGGLWRERGRAPQRTVGVGFTAQADGRGRPFARTPASHDPRVAWIFAGVGDDELIGESGLVMEAAAAFEIDRVDESLGTPRHALVVATATDFSDAYQHVVEEVRSSNSRQGGPDEPRVRADMVYFEAPNGGAVFSASSIAYGGSLPINGYENAAARIAENVVRRFLEPEPPSRSPA